MRFCYISGAWKIPSRKSLFLVHPELAEEFFTDAAGLRGMAGVAASNGGGGRSRERRGGEAAIAAGLGRRRQAVRAGSEGCCRIGEEDEH